MASDGASGAAIAIVPCNDVDAAEAWWNRLGFFGPADQANDDYRMLTDSAGSEVHLQAAVAGWLKPGRNPFCVYVRTTRVKQLAASLDDVILGRGAQHKDWGMFRICSEWA